MNPEILERLQSEFGDNGLDLSIFEAEASIPDVGMDEVIDIDMAPELSVEETFSKISTDITVLGPQEKLDLISMILVGSDIQPIAPEIMTPPIEEVDVPAGLDLPMM